MCNPARDAYLAAMRRLPIKSPSVRDMQAVMPHLNHGRVQAIDRGKKTSQFGQYVKVPPVRVKGFYHVVCVTETELYHAFSGASTKPDSEAEDAMTYAMDMWGDLLVEDTWTAFVNFILVDPVKTTESGFPSNTGIIQASTRCSLDAALNDHSGETLEAQLGEYTSCQIVGKEIKNGRGGFSVWICARCGAGMGLTECTGCGVEVKDDGWRCGGRATLSPSLLQAAHEAGWMRP